MEEEDGKWRKETESKENGEIINGKNYFGRSEKEEAEKIKKKKLE